MLAGRNEMEPKTKFSNPECEPLEDVNLVVEKSTDGVKVNLPAIDACWVKHRPFLSYINPPEKNELGHFPLGAKEDWLERCQYIITDLKWLLHIHSHRFWSQVIHSKSSLNALKSFVTETAPFYLRDISHNTTDEEINKTFKSLEFLVFEVFLRLTTNFISKTEWLREETLGKILYNNFLITVPFLMNMCVCFGQDNHAHLSKAISNVFKYQKKYEEDVKTTVMFLVKVLKKIEDDLNSGGRIRREGPVKLSEHQTNQTSASVKTISKLVYCLLDTLYSFTMFVDICRPAAATFLQHHFAVILADFYENSVPVLCRQIELTCDHDETFDIFCDLKYKLDLARREICNGVHIMLSSYINNILQHKEELSEVEIKKLADECTTVLSDCLADRLFMSEYQRVFPVEHDLDILAQLCPDMDVGDFIFESAMSCVNEQNFHSQKHKPTVPRTTTVPRATTDSSHVNHSYDNQASGSNTNPAKKVTGVELESLITQVKDILPHLGDGFVQKCLDHYNFDSAAVINAVLESLLPESLIGLDPEMPIIPPPEEDTQESNGLQERVNVFDNDEFDLMTRDDVDVSKMHIGKRKAKHKNLIEMLDDKSHVNEMREMYVHLSIVESHEDDIYDDEYDDTYDEASMAVGDEGETERRPFTVPRVLQRRVSLPEELEEEEVVEETDEKDKPKFEYFVANPEELRAKAEQRRQERYRGRGGGPSGSQRDVVGRPKGQGQEKQVKDNREHKNVYKSRSGNHNRRAMASRKRNQGMIPS